MIDNWEVKTLGDIADIKRGLASQHLNYVDSSEEGVRIIRINDFKSDSPKFIKETSETKKLTIKRGDILMAGTGATAGISFLVNDLWNRLPFSYNAPRIRVKNGNSSTFVYFILNSDKIKTQQNKLFTGNAQPFLDTRAIASFIIPLPPLPEQQKIAEILSTVDDKIEVIDQQITETKELKKGLMQRLLTKGIGHTDFKESSLGKIPKNWEVSKLGKLTKSFAGGTPNRSVSEYYNGTIPWIKSGEVNNNNITSCSEHVTELAIQESSAKLIEPNSILVALYGATAGKVGILKIRACSNQAVLAINSTAPNLSNEFLYHYLKKCTSELLKLCQGSGQPNLSKGIVDGVNIPVPSISEQQKIADIFGSVDEKLEILLEKKTHYQELKQGLMQQLLTGKIRVKI